MSEDYMMQLTSELLRTLTILWQQGRDISTDLNVWHKIAPCRAHKVLVTEK